MPTGNNFSSEKHNVDEKIPSYVNDRNPKSIENTYPGKKIHENVIFRSQKTFSYQKNQFHNLPYNKNWPIYKQNPNYPDSIVISQGDFYNESPLDNSNIVPNRLADSFAYKSQLPTKCRCSALKMKYVYSKQILFPDKYL